jgi:hypothetical protein
LRQQDATGNATGAYADLTDPDLADPDLAAIVAKWPTRPERTKAVIVALAKTDLPEHITATIETLIQTARGGGR